MLTVHSRTCSAQNYTIFNLAKEYKKEGMLAYSRLQQQEFDAEKDGYTAAKHQREVGASYFDEISNILSAGQSSTTALKGSTESEQFYEEKAAIEKTVAA